MCCEGCGRGTARRSCGDRTGLRGHDYQKTRDGVVREDALPLPSPPQSESSALLEDNAPDAGYYRSAFINASDFRFANHTRRDAYVLTIRKSWIFFARTSVGHSHDPPPSGSISVPTLRI